jgi:hypothetical protein
MLLEHPRKQGITARFHGQSQREDEGLMQGVTSTVGKSSETPARPHNPDLLNRQRVLERYDTASRPAGKATGAEEAAFSPSAYLMMISRIENQLRRGATDRPAVDQLSRMLAEKLSILTQRTRRSLLELPEVKTLGVDNLSQLPVLARSRLSSGEDTAPLLNLLKTPAFVAAINDEVRTRTYGPQGLLRAS